MRNAGLAAALVLLAACGPFCGSGSFSVTGATVDASYSCPEGSAQQPYDVHVNVTADNPTSNDVTISSATAAMTVSAVHGRWQQATGYRYDAGQVAFSPNRVGKGAKATIQLVIHSACTNNARSGTEANYADYTVQATIVTSAGTFKVTCQNKHRILAP
jgi:hypothetical protein